MEKRYPRKVKKARKKFQASRKAKAEKMLAWMRRQEKSVHGPDVIPYHSYLGSSGEIIIQSGKDEVTITGKVTIDHVNLIMPDGDDLKILNGDMWEKWERGMSGSYDVRSGNTGNEKG